MDGQTEIVNKWVEGYLRNYVAGQQKAWVRWLHLGEYCYNTTQHISIGMSPFRDLYSYDPLSFVEIAFGDSRALDGIGLDTTKPRHSQGIEGSFTEGAKPTKGPSRQAQS
jgi:hypothetical protein